MAPRWFKMAPKRPQEDPRGPMVAPRGPIEPSQRPQVAQGSLQDGPGGLPDLQKFRKINENHCFFNDFCKLLLRQVCCFGRLQGGLHSRQEALRTSSRRPNMPPRGPNTLQDCRQACPRTPQECPVRAWKGFKKAPRWLNRPQVGPKRPQAAPRGLQECPKQPQEAPGWLQHGSRWPRNAPKRIQEAPRWPQEAR